MVQFYFKRIVEKIKFNFIPVYDIEDNSIYGYKIIKDFTAIGFDDKEVMYLSLIHISEPTRPY